MKREGGQRNGRVVYAYPMRASRSPQQTKLRIASFDEN
jgi:hypothetical protein